MLSAVSLKGRLLLLVTALMLATALATLGLIRLTYSDNFARQQLELTDETLRLASQLIKDRYEDFIDRRSDIIRDRRTALQHSLDVFLATMQAEFAQSQRHDVTPEEARRMVLAAARESGRRTGLNFFVFDKNFNGLAHSDQSLEGRNWRHLTGLTGADALEFSRSIVDRDGRDCTILEWPPDGSGLPRQHLACLASFPSWGMYAGVSENYAHIESRSLHDRNELIHDILTSLASIRMGASGTIFVMERRGSTLLLPGSGSARNLLTAHAAEIDNALGQPGNPARLEWLTPGGGRTVFVQYLPTLNWNVGILVNSSELAAPATTLLKRQLMAIGTVFLLGLGLAWLLTRRVTAPISELVQSIQELDPRQGAGQRMLADLRVLARNHSGETGQLAAAWAETLSELDCGLSNLEEAHQELTQSKAELERLNLELEDRVTLRTTALESANRRLRDSEARSRSLFMNSPVPFLEFDLSRLAMFLSSWAASDMDDFVELLQNDPDMTAKCARLVTVLDANPAAVEFFEAGRRTRLLEELKTIITPRSLAGLREMILRFRCGASSYQNSDAMLRTFRHNSRQCIVSARPMPGHESALDRVLISAQDVSRIREGEDRLRALSEAAQAANRTKSEFLANMSHEIRTPLNAILGLAELSQRQKDPEKTSVHLDMIADSAKTLLCVIGDVLDLSRVEAGVLSLAEKDFDLSWTINRAVAPFRAACAGKGVELATDIREGTPRRLKGDPIRLGQVLANLIGNAVKFTEAGSIRVSVAEDSRENGQATLRFCVQDTGVGIAPELTGMIFESFRQADSSFSKTYQGAGLGLAVCRELTTLMGGNIWVESEPGQGSTFCFTASLGLTGEAAGPDAVAATDFDEPPSGLTILIAEDNPINRHVFRETLNSLGHEVILTADGYETLESLRQSVPDMVFMDVQMPRMDGLETVRRIRAGECGPEAARVPVVALTAYAMRGDRELFLEAGMTGYLAKPVTMDALQEAVLLHTGKMPRGRSGVPAREAGGKSPGKHHVAGMGKKGKSRGERKDGHPGGPTGAPRAAGGRESANGADTRPPTPSGNGAPPRAEAPMRPGPDAAQVNGIHAGEDTTAPENATPTGPVTIQADGLHIGTGASAAMDVLDTVKDTSGGTNTGADAARTDAPAQAFGPALARQAFGPLMGEYLGFLRERAAEAGRLLEAGDFDQAAKAGHAVKGTSMFCGLERINVLGAQIEKAARDGDTLVATRAVRELQQALSELDGEEAPPASPRSMA